MDSQTRKMKGITLIALVITIIVLLILAGVSIATLTGENGILTQATTAKKQTEIAEAKEQAQLDIAAWRAERLRNNENSDLTTDIIKDILTGKDYVGTVGDNSFTTEKNGYEVLYSDLDKDITTGGGTATLPSNDDTKPFLPEGATVVNDDLATGVVIKDSKENEWVWIEVPKSIYTNTTYNGGTAPTGSNDYEKIESTMQAYASAYRKDGYTDTWYSEDQHGFANAEAYNNHKNNMLKSVYENGGFYIGRYEVGISSETGVPRTSEDDALTTPIIQRDSYPYNFVTGKQAQSLSNQLATGGKTSSLLFGIQWDLVLKFIETKGGKTQDELKTDSSTWGNYKNVSFDITRGRYSTNYPPRTFSKVESSYTKPIAASSVPPVLLTTGATDRNSTLNIYDLVGNVFETTLEYTEDTWGPCSARGGLFADSGNRYPASYRYNCSSTPDIHFRLSLSFILSKTERCENQNWNTCKSYL